MSYLSLGNVSYREEFEVSDSLARKLMAAGASKQQVNSAVVKIMLAVLADSENAFDAVEEFRRIKSDLQEELVKASNAKYRANEREREADKKKQEYEKLLSETKEYELNIDAIETAEARDRFRLAEYFKKNVTTKNVYQETEYIKGLSGILSGVEAKKGEDDVQT